MPQVTKAPFSFPSAALLQRRMDFIIETVDGETLLYDQQRHKAFCLNCIASAIWRLCDGAHNTAQIADAASVELGTAISEEAVLLAFEDFRRDDLIEPSVEPLPAAMLSRRDIAIKLGVSAAMMLPVIAAVVAPRAAQAYSGCADC